MSVPTKRRRAALHALLAVACPFAAAPDATAQEPETFRACFVAQVGAMYLIALPGLPTECLSANHEEISWSEGGAAPGEGSVGDVEMADGVIVRRHLREGVVGGEEIEDGSIG